MRTCEYCGGNADSGCGPTHDLKTHYSKIDCAEFMKLQKYEAAADYLEAEAKKIPLGEGNQQRGFSSTYNALAFAVEVLRAACALKPVGEAGPGNLCPECVKIDPADAWAMPCPRHKTEKRKDERPCICDPGRRSAYCKAHV